MKELGNGRTLAAAALKSNMDPKTARKYRESGLSPEQAKKPRYWRTRTNPFEMHWEQIVEYLDSCPGILVKTIFDHLCRENPGQYKPTQLRTLQRLIKKWRALEGASKEAMFPQVHNPGELSASDFTHMDSLNVTVDGKAFPHMFYHFVLTYSNWEDVTICFSESFESLSAGFQNAMIKAGGVTKYHRTDNLTAGYIPGQKPKKLTEDFQALLSHYNVKPQAINAGEPHENGDAESSHKYFKKAIEQELLLRGSNDFQSRQEYLRFVEKIVTRRNKSRLRLFSEEQSKLASLPENRLVEGKERWVKVSPSSTIRVLHNTYSVHSRLIGETVKVLSYSDRLEIYYANQRVECLPRMRGEGNHKIQYRHIIDSLVKKPGAFKNYRYRESLFPTSQFRLAYDQLCENNPRRATKQYLSILNLAAKQGEQKVELVLRYLIHNGLQIELEYIEAMLVEQSLPAHPTTQIQSPDLAVYDSLFQGGNQ